MGYGGPRIFYRTEKYYTASEIWCDKVDVFLPIFGNLYGKIGENIDF